jgi:peptidyl-tRNA hydrolase
MSADELRMYILLNSTVKMKPGKAVAQSGHGISEMTEFLVKTRDTDWSKYTRHSHAKIALKCPEHLLNIIYHKYKNRSQSVWCLDVEDEGRTQVPEGTRTVIVFKPMRRVDAPEELNTLQLY